MNVSISPELERFVQEKIASGLYTTASEVVREALRLLREQDQTLDDRRAQLDAKIRRGLDQLAREERVTDIEVREHFRSRSEAARRKRA